MSAVTAVPLSEIDSQTCVQTFIPLAESKNKIMKTRYMPSVFMHLMPYIYFMRAAQQRQHRENGLFDKLKRSANALRFTSILEKAGINSMYRYRAARTQR